MRGVALGALVAVALGPGAAQRQQQPPTARSNWPCGGRVDPSYFQIAEASGGDLLMLAPWEIADSAALLQASSKHPHTIFRLGGTINPGAHEFRVPIDPAVESVMFSISVQCLQTAEVLDPSGQPPSGEGVTDLSNVAERVVIVNRPAAGTWTIRAAGSGVAGVMVTARTAVSLANVEFAAVGSDRFRPVPVAGVDNIVRIAVAGQPARVEGAMVNAAAKEIAPLTFAPGDAPGVYVSRFTPGSEPFRVLIRGSDSGGGRVSTLRC